MKAKVNKVTIHITKEDILSLAVDGIVNSTDPTLILPASWQAPVGTPLQVHLETFGGCAVGDAIITDAGNLTTTQKIIHTAGPRWGEGSERGKLSNAMWATLNVAEDNQLKSIALPPISVGTFGYPVESCARIMLGKIIDFTFEKLKYLRTVHICLDNDNFLDIFQKEFIRQLEVLKNSGEGKVRV